MTVINNKLSIILIWELSFTEVLTSQRRSERDSHKQDHGSEHSNGSLVSSHGYSQRLNLDFTSGIAFERLNFTSIDHAHPTWVAGHPFKGSWVYSTGQLLHPDMKRFTLNTAVLFKPPFPGKNPYDHFQTSQVPSFTDFFSAYFGKYKVYNESSTNTLTNRNEVEELPNGVEI